MSHFPLFMPNPIICTILPIKSPKKRIFTPQKPFRQPEKAPNAAFFVKNTDFFHYSLDLQ
ncbi:hypothetical protein SAMN02746062_01117 [Alysiella filiformis DSM 16848]|uniref:Uncharacterized protein n=1 Tax=Alysiella filiformis DSM 16848 TaxID=1120981 RepID=A0A286EB19_9NEIS|nr:hypothetical protein SAMN02746062_01117 [Alysiella filiformis DSM 16848]